MTQPTWTRAIDLDRLVAGRGVTVKLAGKQVAVFLTDDGAVHAVDNRCPHEGYPLATGAMKGDTLTCEWHNWKFRLRDGVCVMGGEDVRAYPVRIDAGAVWLDLAEPAPETVMPGLFRSLEKAFDEQDWSHAARTVERLLAAGEKPAEILAHGCVWAAERAPYGFDHGLAATADVAFAISRRPDDADVLVVEALNLMVEPNVRRPVRKLDPPEQVDSLDGVEQELRRRIEAEDVAGAEALFRGALVAGVTPEQAFRWLVHAATDHFLDYGHAHIYCVKAEELLATIGWHYAHPVLTSLVSSIALGTREDRLPYMRSYVRAMDGYTPRLAQWAALSSQGAAFDVDGFLASVVDGTLEQALAAVAHALDERVAPDRIARALALAASHRLLRFDPDIEARDDVSEGWLDITHLLTHADALHETLRRRPSAEALRALFHSARFIQHTGVLDLPVDGRPVIERAEPGLADRLPDVFLTEPGTLPIFVAHRIKTPAAAVRVTNAIAADPVLAHRADRDLALVATARFLDHPIAERRIARRTRFARTFVREGRMHDKLLGY